MNYFINHELAKNQDGYEVTLYLDQQLNEFAVEFDQLQDNKKITLKNKIRNYIHNNFPELKIKTVNIMLGSLLVASLPFASINSSHVEAHQQVNSEPNQRYIVKPGDTLSEIAAKYDITVAQLKKANQITSNLIYIDQELYIPQQTEKQSDHQLPSKVYKLGDQGKEVKKIQQILNNLGNSLVTDGIYGPKTEEAILNFQQQDNKLLNDGIYGSQTQNSLEEKISTNNNQVSAPSNPLTIVNKNNTLPPDYTPEELVVPNVTFTFDEFHQKKLMRPEAASALEKMFNRAKQENINLYATSGYRSFDRQARIFNSNVEQYGLHEANQFSAKPGESEHQTGLAMDVTSPTVNFHLTKDFGATEEGQWLKKNAAKFGFIIRYPEEKEEITGYTYEPWHIRYIGDNPAQRIAENNSTLEEYLGRV